jgi:hypothetical protein
MLIENPSMIQMQEGESDKSQILINKKGDADKYQDDDKMTLPDEIRNLRKQ